MVYASAIALEELSKVGEGDGGYIPVWICLSLFSRCVFPDRIKIVALKLYLETNFILRFLFRSPANPSHVAVKRVVGLPGDRITTRKPCLRATQIVPYNHVWVEGDAEDPDRSMDSNTYGPVSISLIGGRVMGVLSPRMRWLDWTKWESGHMDGAEPDSRLGPNYRQEVRDRVVKDAVKLERPPDF